MKWFILFSLVPMSIFACVDLTGNYRYCHRVQGSSNELNPLTIWQSIPGGNEYVINGRTIVADDLSRVETPDVTGNDSDLSMTYSCDDKELIVVMRDPNDPKLEITMRYSKQGTALVVKSTAKAPYDHINDVNVCD